MDASTLAPDSTTPVSLYGRLREVLRARILEGHYAPESKLPSENELGAVFQVSRITVRQALGDLEKEGLIFRLHGKGSYVAKPKAFQDVSRLQGFAEAMASLGHQIVNQLHSLQFLPAPGHVAERLALPEGTSVAEIRRVRLLNGVTVSLEVTFVPQSIGQALQRADLITRDIFLILENDLAITLGHADLSIDAILADSELVGALGVEPGAPILRIERLTHDAAGQPLDFEYLYFRGDAFQYRLRSNRQSPDSGRETDYADS